MKRNALTYLLLPFLLALLVTACKDDTLPASPAEEEEAGSGVYVSVVVNTGGSNASRADGATDEYNPTGGEKGDVKWPGESYENTIHNLYLYFFDGGEDENGVRKGINADANTPILAQVSFDNTSLSGSGQTYYTQPVEINELQIGKTYDVLAIANIKTTINSVTLGELRDNNLKAIRVSDKQWFIMSSANPEFDAERKINSVKIETGNTINNPATVSIDVERLEARIDCHVESSYSVEETGDQVSFTGFIVVNKYVANDNYENSYVFKRVSENIELSNNKVVYLEDEETQEGIATNYVIGPMTLTPPTLSNESHHYDNSFYFHHDTPGDWEDIWKQLNNTVTSEQNGITYHLLDYTQENIVPANVAETECAKYCTGIVFKAQYRPAGITTTDGTFYEYQGKFYNTPEDTGIPNISPYNYEMFGVVKYEGGICYYTYWIKHADDGDDTKVSPMEYAIVRNNIYQINVTGVSGIGTVTPTDYGLYLTCTVADWVEENAIDIDFTESTAYKGDFVGVSVKKDENAVLVAYSQDNEFRDAQFTFRMQTPRGATWTAHLSNPDDFELVGDYIGVGTGTDSSNEGLVTLTVRARRPFEEGSERTTALYITTNVFDNPIAFNQGSGESTLFPGENTYIRIRQVSTTDYDNTQEITDDNQGN